jgi:hypothetical protein
MPLHLCGSEVTVTKNKTSCILATSPLRASLKLWWWRARPPWTCEACLLRPLWEKAGLLFCCTSTRSGCG